MAHLEPQFRSVNLVLGSAVHGAAGWFFQERLEGREPTIEDAETVLRADLCAEICEATIRWKDGSPEALEAEGVRLVRTYLTAHASLGVVAVEQPFSVPLHAPATGEILGRPLKGFFDFVLEDRVVELKTTAKPWSENDLPRHLQVGAYCYASHLLHGGDARLEVHTIVKLKTKPRVERFVVERNATQLGWWLRAAAEIEQAISAGMFPPTPSSFLCRDCEYERACQDMGLAERAPTPAPRRLQLVWSSELSL